MLGVKVGDSYIATSQEFFIGMDALPAPTAFQVVGILNSDIELGIVSLEFLNQHDEYSRLPVRYLVVAHEGKETAVDDFLHFEIYNLKTFVMTNKIMSERILNEALPGLLMLLPIVLFVAIAFSLLIVIINQLANTRRLPEFGILYATGRSKRWLTQRLTMETTSLTLAGWAIGIGLSYLVVYLLKVSIFAARGHDLNYLVWLPVVCSLIIPAATAGFTYLAVRKTFKRLDAVAIVERRELSQEADQRHPRTASSSSPKPLAPATFYKRHRRRAALLIGGMSLTILAVGMFIFALAVGADAKEPFLGYLKKVSIVRSVGIVESLDPRVVKRVETHPAVSRVIPVAPRVTLLNVYIPPFSGAEASPLGVYAEDMQYLIDLYGLELREGQLPVPGSNQMVIVEALAQNRDLEVGDVIGDPEQPAYPGAPSLETEFVISGIFATPKDPENGVGLGFISLEYLESQEAYPLPDIPSLIVVPNPGQKDVLDDWLVHELHGTETSVLTYQQEVSRIQNKAKQDMLSIALLEGLIAIVAAIGLSVLNYIFNSQRFPEFAVLNALGYERRKLVGRVLAETSFTSGIAWVLSLMIGLIAMLVLRSAVFTPLGLTYNLFDLTAWLYTLPIPFLVIFVTSITTGKIFSGFDPVSIIARGITS